METIAALKQGAGGNILVQGSATLVKGLLEAGLIDELKILINPYMMGTSAGRLFDGMQGALELISVQSLDKGVISTVYKPIDR
ncbi:dihydrofolate reductase family protein [Paraflavitalea speifideaquila]|uniref:dihydrofolate reductase family protein n=1 Tax=Paraflavitalea speifideaquila TaxID=3076558 RepID=UPI0028ED0F0F|nr:dihydrofolate reductase family protein [Paraflavitalea speifideiaquila]